MSWIDLAALVLFFARIMGQPTSLPKITLVCHTWFGKTGTWESGRHFQSVLSRLVLHVVLTVFHMLYLFTIL